MIETRFQHFNTKRYFVAVSYEREYKGSNYRVTLGSGIQFFETDKSDEQYSHAARFMSKR